MTAPVTAELARLLVPDLLPFAAPTLQTWIAKEVRRQLAVARGESLPRAERTRAKLAPVLLTVEKAAPLAGLDRSAAYNKISQGLLPVVRIQRPGMERGSVRVPAHWASIWQALGSGAAQMATTAADVVVPVAPDGLSVEQAAGLLSLSHQVGYRLVRDAVLQTRPDGRVDPDWLAGWLLETIQEAERAYERGRA